MPKIHAHSQGLDIDLTIIIVSFNTKELLKRCLISIYREIEREKSIRFEVIVVDNASTDGSYEMIQQKFPDVHGIKNSKNVGFSKANNQAMNTAAGTCILLLNSDTEVEKGSLKKLYSPLLQNRSIGVTGGKLLNTDGSIQQSTGFTPTLFRVLMWMFFMDDLPWIQRFIHPYHVTDQALYTSSRFVDWVSGACFCIRREVLETVGGFDEHIFMYAEEVEWCYRIKMTGLEVLYISEATLYHNKGGSGSGKDSGIVEEFAGMHYFYQKHRCLLSQIILRFILSVGALLRIGVFGIIGKYPHRCALYAKAFDMARR